MTHAHSVVIPGEPRKRRGPGSIYPCRADVVMPGDLDPGSRAARSAGMTAEGGMTAEHPPDQVRGRLSPRTRGEVEQAAREVLTSRELRRLPLPSGERGGVRGRVTLDPPLPPHPDRYAIRPLPAGERWSKRRARCGRPANSPRPLSPWGRGLGWGGERLSVRPCPLTRRASAPTSPRWGEVEQAACAVRPRGAEYEVTRMVDAVLETQLPAAAIRPRATRGAKLRRRLRSRSSIAFFLTLPLMLLVALLVIYPAFYSLHLATLNKSMERFVGLGNFTFLFKRETFWMVVQQSCIFAITAVIFKAIIGFVVAHFVHNIPSKGQRKWRGMLLVPWVIPPAMSCLAWLWLFDPSYSAFNWILDRFGIGPVAWTGDASWARFSVILVNVWIGAPFFMIMYLAALKSVPEQLYEAAAIDGANWWQRMWYITLPMMRNIIAITALFSLIVTFANFDIVRIITAGGPIDKTHVFATWSFWLGIQGNDIPLGAAVSLFMIPILAVAAVFILRDIHRRGSEVA